MIYNILPETDSMLSEKCQRFDFENPPMDPTELFQNLKETMIANRGMGLSAPQVGIPYQAFVIGNPSEPDSVFSVFNPTIVDSGGIVQVIEEGCLTFPGLFVKVKRPNGIRVRFSGHDGKVSTIKFEGYTARVFQHEYDHLFGVTMIDRVSKLQLDRAKQLKKKLDKKRERALKSYA